MIFYEYPDTGIIDFKNKRNLTKDYLIKYNQ